MHPILSFQDVVGRRNTREQSRRYRARVLPIRQASCILRLSFSRSSVNRKMHSADHEVGGSQQSRYQMAPRLRKASATGASLSRFLVLTARMLTMTGSIGRARAFLQFTSGHAVCGANRSAWANGRGGTWRSASRSSSSRAAFVLATGRCHSSSGAGVGYTGSTWERAVPSRRNRGKATAAAASVVEVGFLMQWLKWLC